MEDLTTIIIASFPSSQPSNTDILQFPTISKLEIFNHLGSPICTPSILATLHTIFFPTNPQIFIPSNSKLSPHATNTMSSSTHQAHNTSNASQEQPVDLLLWLNRQEHGLRKRWVKKKSEGQTILWGCSLNFRGQDFKSTALYPSLVEAKRDVVQQIFDSGVSEFLVRSSQLISSQ